MLSESCPALQESPIKLPYHPEISTAFTCGDERHKWLQYESRVDEEGVTNIKNPHWCLSWRQNWASSSSRTERYEEPLVSIYLVTLSNYSYIWSKVKIPFIPVNEGHADQDFDMINYSLSNMPV